MNWTIITSLILGSILVVIHLSTTSPAVANIKENEINSLSKNICDKYRSSGINLDFGFEKNECLNIEEESYNSLEKFSVDKNIDPNLLLALIKVESSGNCFDSSNYPTLRFECHKFNERNLDEKVNCDIGDKGFSEVSSQTNKNAFQNARKIDENNAILSTSFGCYQILGENYEKVGYSSPLSFLEDIEKSEEKQTEIFLKFIENTPGLIFAISQKDFDRIALLYNGPSNTKEYSEKLENAYS